MAPASNASTSMSRTRRQAGLFSFASRSSTEAVPRPGTMTRSAPRSVPLLLRDPQRNVVTRNGKARFAALLIWLAVAITSWVMAALEAMQPWISTTATLVMSKNTRTMSFLTLAALPRNRNDQGMRTSMRARQTLGASRRTGNADAEPLHEAGRSARGFQAPRNCARRCHQEGPCGGLRTRGYSDDGDAGHQPARRTFRPLGARRRFHGLHAVIVRPRRRRSRRGGGGCCLSARLRERRVSCAGRQ